MPATTTATLTGAQTDQAVFEQFQQVPLRLWTKNQLAAATNMGYARIDRSVNRLVASGQVTMVRHQVFRGVIHGTRPATYILAELDLYFF